MSNDLPRLHRLIVRHYDLQELQTLCFDLGINYSDLGGEGISAKVRELILLMGRERQLERLLKAINESRPTVLAGSGLKLDNRTLELLYRSLPAFNESNTFDMSSSRFPGWKLVTAIAALIPITVAIVAFFYLRGSSLGGDTFTVDVSGGSVGGDITQISGDATFYNLSFVTEQAGELSDEELPEDVIQMITQATELVQEQAYNDAIPLLESAAREAPLPAIYNNLGAAYLAIGDQESAKENFAKALAIEPDDQAALSNLSQLPPGPISDIQLVNFSSQRFAHPCNATHILDESPGSIWCSQDGNFPQSFVVRLPREHLISRISFDNSPTGETDQNAREVQILISLAGEDVGYQDVGTFILNEAEISQGFEIDPPVRGRWVKLNVLSNHGNTDRTRLAGFRVIGQATLAE